MLDIVARVDDALLQRLGSEPGGCLPVEAGEMAALLALPEVAASQLRCERVRVRACVVRSSAPCLT